MRIIVARIGRGDPPNATVPIRLRDHMIAAAYGSTPAAVREWPANDYLDAWAFLPATRGPR